MRDKLVYFSGNVSVWCQGYLASQNKLASVPFSDSAVYHFFLLFDGAHPGGISAQSALCGEF